VGSEMCIRDSLRQYVPGAQVYQHPMGVDCEFFQPNSAAAGKATAIFVGNFRHAPNLHGAMWFLREVWPRIRARYPEAHLYLVGGSPPAELEGLDGFEGVNVTGFVDDVRPYLQGAAVFVAPLFEGGGLRTKILEAWAMQKPVVGTPLAFEGLAKQCAEVCCMAGDAETFADRVCELFNNPEWAMQIGARARELVLPSFSWENFAAVYDHIYGEALGSAEPPTAHPVRAAEVSGLAESRPQVRGKATGG